MTTATRSRFVLVPAHAIRSRLSAAGFTLLEGHGEEVYERRHNRHADFAVKVYTSLPRGGDVVRGCGEDAIRVCAVRYYAWHKGEERMDLAGIGGGPQGLRAHGLESETRVFRTGTVEGVLDRMIERAREAYSFISEQLKPRDDNTGGYRQ